MLKTYEKVRKSMLIFPIFDTIKKHKASLAYAKQKKHLWEFHECASMRGLVVRTLEKTKTKEIIMSNAKKDIVSKDKLLEAGVYFGHKKDKWNPKMKPYINGVKKGTHIIDIEKSKRTLEFAYSLIKSYAEKGATFVFVGTRKQAKEAVKANALRTNSFYVSERWLGGTLTNSRTIFQRVRRMEELEQLAATNYAGYTKKEGVLFAKELAKLHKNLQGIREMRRKPNVMIVADPSADDIAVKEAQRLGVKVIGIVDTNNDPSSVNVAIPGNDDSVKSVTLILTILADAIAEAKGGKPLFAFQADDAIVLPEELKKEFKPRPAFGDRPRRFGDRPAFNRENRAPRTENSERPARVRTADAAAKPAAVAATNSNDLSALKLVELKDKAKAKGIHGFSTMKKQELIDALSK